MATRTKEEQERLEEKIARIKKKEEEILRRKKEIEEDIRLAEQKDALVKLRPSTTNLSRERTPALRPSNRELREDFSDEPFQEPVGMSPKDSFRGRGGGGERYRGQGDWKATGPPPDPRSFLYDDERDAPLRDKEGKEDLRKRLDRRNRDDREGEHRGGREFQRGGRRGAGDDGGNRRGGRGRGGRGGGGAADDTAWRAERLRIDEARIERQKASDGRWRREWDNEKVDPQFDDEPRFEQRRACPQHPHQDHHDPHHHDHHHDPHHHDHHHHHGHHDHHHQHHHQHAHSQSYVPASVPRQLPRDVHSRGRGRFDPAQLEMPLDGVHIEVLKKPMSPVKPVAAFQESPRQRQQIVAADKTLLPQTKVVRDYPREVECVGSSVKISIANASPPKTTAKGQRTGERRPRPQPNYSSQSDEDSPRDRGQRRQRAPRHQRSHPRPAADRKVAAADGSAEKGDLPPQNKPPLPPFKAEEKAKKEESGDVTSNAAGDDSWEDVTTSGAESMGEDALVGTVADSGCGGIEMPGPAPIVEMAAEDHSVLASLGVSIEPSDQPFDQYLSRIKAYERSDSRSAVATEGVDEPYVGNDGIESSDPDADSSPQRTDSFLGSCPDLRSAREQFDEKYIVVDENAECGGEKRLDLPTPLTIVGASDTHLSESANALVADDVIVKGENKDSVVVGDGETNLSNSADALVAADVRDFSSDVKTKGEDKDSVIVVERESNSSEKQNVLGENCEKSEVTLNDKIEIEISQEEKIELVKSLISGESSKVPNPCEIAKKDATPELTNNDNEK